MHTGATAGTTAPDMTQRCRHLKPVLPPFCKDAGEPDQGAHYQDMSLLQCSCSTFISWHSCHRGQGATLNLMEPRQSPPPPKGGEGGSGFGHGVLLSP